MSTSRVIQFTPTLSFGDAVSNDIFAMSAALSENGYENKIVSITASPKVTDKTIPLSSFIAKKSDVFLYHMSIGSDLTDYIISSDVKHKLMVYHNITPEKYFQGIPLIQDCCIKGRLQLEKLAEHIELAFCDSDYNKAELDTLNYKNTTVLPIIFDDSDYKNTVPSKKIIDLYKNDDFINILFVGRIAPNKKQEDVIASFYMYNKYINPKSRLFLVGSYSGMENYKDSLDDYIAHNNIRNVIFPGHITFPEILAYYKSSDIFLCESEHEGFCVPLLEAMIFDLPIIAYSSSAIPSTLGGSGIMFAEKDPRLVAELINLIAEDNLFRNKIIEKQRQRLADFDINKVKKDFIKIIQPFID